MRRGLQSIIIVSLDFRPNRRPYSGRGQVKGVIQVELKKAGLDLPLEARRT